MAYNWDAINAQAMQGLKPQQPGIGQQLAQSAASKLASQQVGQLAGTALGGPVGGAVGSAAGELAGPLASQLVGSLFNKGGPVYKKFGGVLGAREELPSGFEEVDYFKEYDPKQAKDIWRNHPGVPNKKAATEFLKRALDAKSEKDVQNVAKWFPGGLGQIYKGQETGNALQRFLDKRDLGNKYGQQVYSDSPYVSHNPYDKQSLNFPKHIQDEYREYTSKFRDANPYKGENKSGSIFEELVKGPRPMDFGKWREQHGYHVNMNNGGEVPGKKKSIWGKIADKVSSDFARRKSLFGEGKRPKTQYKAIGGMTPGPLGMSDMQVLGKPKDVSKVKIKKNDGVNTEEVELNYHAPLAPKNKGE